MSNANNRIINNNIILMVTKIQMMTLGTIVRTTVVMKTIFMAIKME